MIKKSNFQMLRELDFKPQEYGFLTGPEVKKIRDHFQIHLRSNLDLQNLRDFVVLYYSNKIRSDRYDRDVSDLMSAIVGVIDSEKFERGMEV